MAQTSYDISKLPKVSNGRAVILVSKWYREHSESMVAKCREVLLSAGCLDPEVHVLPGCFEIPLAARRLAKRDPKLEAIIVFGVIVKGDTYHFDIVKDLTMSGLERVIFECDIPIINEILPVDSLDHVVARSGDNDKNKGYEAGLAAVEIIDWRRRNADADPALKS
jgi:6,7-dimethyl-8-ribityllumazine synthase